MFPVRNTICALLVSALLALAPPITAAASPAAPSASPEGPTLVRAAMCESITKFMPDNEAVIFSIELGRIYSFTEFDPVPKKSVVFHRWYHRGNLVSVKKLTVNPPRWSIFSSMQLREADRGPWQVEVLNSDKKLLRTLRFSITD